MTRVKPGMLVQWRNWQVPASAKKFGLAIDVYDTPDRQPFASPSAAVIWMGEVELQSVFLRFLEPVPAKQNA